MNKLSYILIFAGFSMILNTSCKKEKLLTYNADDNIYFRYIINADPATNYIGIYTDSLNITFAFRGNNSQDTLIGIPVAVTGTAKDHDRTFAVTVDPSSTAVVSKHYELPASFVVRAGKLIDSMFVRFKRTADLKTASVSLKLLLKPNDQFKTQLKFRSKSPHDLASSIQPTDTVSNLMFKLNISDMLAEGPYWNDYSYYFGDFTEKKVRLINQIIGMPLDFWSIPLKSDQQKRDVTYYGGFMFRYLGDLAFAGKTVFEADGVTPMEMGYFFR